MPLPPSDNPVSREDIDRVVRGFYAKARRDPTLGPVFTKHVGQDAASWRAHEAKIAAFWRKAILREPGFDGSPMAAHLAAGDLTPAHFPKWLDLFDATLFEELPADVAAAWSHIAHRIGRGLKIGIVAAENSQSEIPKLV